jgi:cytoskeletal protein CcmA (bactofilin family)
VAKVEGLIRAKTAHIEGTIKLKGDRFEADKIECTGILTVEGEINADNVIAEGVINAREIYGDYIEINSHFKHMFGFFDGFFSGYRCSKIGIIEATTVSISGVKCDTVNGHDVTIGEGCKVKNVCCDGVLNIHPNAQVENITGNDKK